MEGHLQLICVVGKGRMETNSMFFLFLCLFPFHQGHLEAQL